MSWESLQVCSVQAQKPSPMYSWIREVLIMVRNSTLIIYTETLLSIISPELLIRHIPNILYSFKGLHSGRTNSSSSLGHHWSFLEEDAQSNDREKNHFLSPAWIYSPKRSHPKITGRAKPIPLISPMPMKYCKNWEQTFPFISKGRKRALTH